MRTALVRLFAGLALALVGSTAEAQQVPPWVIGSLDVTEVTPAPYQISRGIRLDAEPDRVLEMLADDAAWVRLVPAIESVDRSGSQRVGQRRAVTLTGGARTREKLVAFDMPVGRNPGLYAWSIAPGNPLGMTDHLAALELLPAEDGGTRLTFFQAFNHPDADAMLPTLGGIMDGLLAGLVHEFGGERLGTTYGNRTLVIEQRRLVDAPAEKVWQALADDWGGIADWARIFVESSATAGRDGSLVGSVRTCTMPGAPPYRERMVAYDADACRLEYAVLEDGMPPFITGTTNTWTVTSIGDDRSLVVSRSEMAIAPGTPASPITMVKSQFTPLIAVTHDDLKHYAETGTPHPANDEKAGGAR